MYDFMKLIFHSLLNLLQPYVQVFLIAGALIVLAALVWLVFMETRRNLSDGSVGLRFDNDAGSRWRYFIPLCLLITIGALLRFSGLDEKTITHPEVYIPGISLPAGISEPPPRFELSNLLQWHFYREPHPLGYYLAMFGWTTLFGAGLAAIRMPGAIVGILSIPLVFRIGSLAYDRTVGLIAGGLLALHGFHIYWSQQARMYVPECFFGLVATWLLLEILRAHNARGLLEAAYVVTMFAGFSTEWFFWPLAGAHVLFTLLHFARNRDRMSRLLYFQILAMVLGAYTLSQAITTMGSAGSGEEPALETLLNFVTFGSFYAHDIYSEPVRMLPDWFVIAAFFLSIGLLARGMTLRPVAIAAPTGGKGMPALGPILLAALGMTVLMTGLALPTLPYPRSLFLVTIFPLIALLALAIVPVIGPRLRLLLDPLEKRRNWVASCTSLVVISVLFPLLIIFLTNAFMPMMASRALLVFAPFFLIVVAAGGRSLIRSKVLAIPVALTLVAFFTASAWHFRTMPNSPRDYEGLARVLEERLEPGDVVFVIPRKWYVTPVFYYLDASWLIGANYSAAIEGRSRARVWILLFGGEKMAEELRTALKGFRFTGVVRALGSKAILYERVLPVSSAGKS